MITFQSSVAEEQLVSWTRKLFFEEVKLITKLSNENPKEYQKALSEASRDTEMRSFIGFMPITGR